MNKFKKLAICSLSLLMTIGIGNSNVSVNAQHVRRSYHRTTRIRQHYKTLNFKHLIQAMNKDYRSKNRFIHKKIDYTLYKNRHSYSAKQLAIIVNNFDFASDISFYVPRLYKDYENMYTKHISCANNIHKLSQQDNAFDTDLRADLVKDINQTRVKYHRKPLVVTNLLQSSANYRAPKVLYAFEHPMDSLKYEHLSPQEFNIHGGLTDGWVHGVDTHTTGYAYLQKHGYSPNNWSANAIDWFHTYYCTDDDGTMDKYPDTTPTNIAYNINDDLMNHDMAHNNNNGHRRNELDPIVHYLGVGVNYDPVTQKGSINEQFAG